MLFIHAKIQNIFRYETLKNLNEKKKRKLMEMLSDDVKTYFKYKKKKERKKGVVVFKVHLECY